MVWQCLRSQRSAAASLMMTPGGGQAVTRISPVLTFDLPVRGRATVTAEAVTSLRNSKGEEVVTDMQNPRFERFYREQAICPDSEFPEFLAACRRGLPSVFRVLTTRPEHKLLSDKLRKLSEIPGSPLEPLGWYPCTASTGSTASTASTGSTAYKLNNTTRWDLVQQESLHQLHRLIDNLRVVGAIYRQEQVSMVPVLCLDLEPHHNVLDMCSSPGSKTGQVLEIMLRGINNSNNSCSSNSSSSLNYKPGLVVANEPDQERCFNLTGNLKLINSPQLMVTSYDGQTFPHIYTRDGEKLQYDRIVCDVPCSGDGTIRKNPNIWETWHPGRGNNRHFLQYNIAKRGLELLKVGGMMAYSSCSINQIENEAVISRLLQAGEGSLELVDQTGKFAGLTWAPGLNTWRVLDHSMNRYNQYQDVPRQLHNEISPHMFPPDTSAAARQNLNYCMRFLPQHNDDGGFFVAIIRKTRELPEWKVTRPQLKRGGEPLDVPVSQAWAKTNKPQHKHLLFNRAGYRFLDNDCATSQAVEKWRDFYGAEIPQHNLISRKNEQELGKTVSVVGEALREVLANTKNDKLRVASLGVRILDRERRKCAASRYRLTSNSCHLVAGGLKRRHLNISTSEFTQFLSAEEGEGVEISCLDDGSATTLKQLNYGECLVRLQLGSSSSHVIHFPAFSSQTHVVSSLGPTLKKYFRFLLTDPVQLS